MTDKAYLYSIENKVNGKCYIGSTVNLKSRWAAHKTTLRGGRHHSFILQKVCKTPEYRAKLRAAHLGRVWPKNAVDKMAKSKWKPVYCKELGVSFLSQKFAAEHLNVGTAAVSQGIKNKGKVANVTLIRVNP